MFKKKFPSLSSLGSDGNTAFLRAARAGHLDKVLEHLKANIDINTSNTNGLNALHLASKDGHVPVVTELIKRGAVVDSATKKGNTALHIASLAGQEDVVKLLVASGAAVNVQSQNGFTPLYMAAQENHDNVVRFLLANGANQSLATEDGFTPLAVAMQQGHDKVVAVLLENDTRGKVRLPALHIAAKKDDCKAAALLLQNEHNPDVTSKSGFTPLHIAAHYGNEGIANLLLNRGADVNYSAKHNISPLHVAAKWGKTNLVSLLLEKGATIESKTRDGLTPLHCAARSGHEQVVDMMLERQAPISSKTKNGLAPLHMAAQGDHVDAARILLYHRAPVDEVTVDYLTALHVAAHCGHVRVAKLLLDRKADPNARALNGFTPLHIACKKNRIKVVELLLKHGGSIEATTESGLTPLHVASFMGCMNIVIFLLQNDASPDVPTVRGETPLHLAARANQTDIIRILLRNGAQVDARAREQQTPLHIASRLGNVDIVMLLLQHGAAVDSTTKDMYTALHIAAKEGQEEVASVLLEHGASLTATTKKGFTPLHLAAKYGNIKVAKLLLQKEAPVDAQGKNGVTPLHVASHYDHQNVALLLLDKGASPHATAKNGHTPLHIAARKNQMDIATTLLEYGAKANAESKAGFTPLHLSAQEGHTDMSTLLIEHQADTNHKAKNGLSPLHLCAQEDRVNVATILVKNGAQVDSTTKAGYTPLHVASHFGQVNMIRFLVHNGADVAAPTSVGYTPLHQAAQQGHTTIVNLLLEKKAPPNIQTNQGQTPLSIAQKLGYISVVETLKGVTEPAITNVAVAGDEKYRVVAPETMQETFMSDSEDEGGEDAMLSDQPYRYLTVDEMKSLGDDSLPIDVTRDERIDSNRECMAPPQAVDDTISPQHAKESYSQFAANYAADNIDISRHPVHVGKLHWKNFLVSFLVDARGGAMRGCRHSGVRVIVPPRKAPSPMRVTCRYLKRDKLAHPPPLMEGEALASRILELGPVGGKFLGPVIIEVPHFGSLRGTEREIVILRSDNGETWREHTTDAGEDVVHDVLNESFEADEISALEEPSSGRTTRILTTDFPQYFAVVSRIRQEVHAIGPEGGMVSSSVVPQVQAVFPQGALTKKIKVGLQAQPIAAELAAKLLGNRVAVSPIVTVEPRRRKFHKPITLTIPVPQAANKGMINQYSGDAPTLRLLCSITGGTTRAQWEDVTGSTPLTFVNDCVSFTTTVSARFWLMDCRNIADATKMATELYREAIHVPFMAKFVVFAKRTDLLEARLRVFCMTDDKEDKTLEHQEHFTEVAKSRDVEVLEGKSQYVEFAGNLVPVTKSGDQLQLGFRAFRENRLPFTVRVKDPHADTVGRVLFMREARVAKGEPPQQPICILNIMLPENIVPEATTLEADLQALSKKYSFLRDGGLGRLESYQRTDLRLSDISNLLGQDWVPLASELDITSSEVNDIKTECQGSVAQQAMAMLRLWLQQAGNKANGNTLETALRKIGRDDIVEQCIFNVDVARVQRGTPKEDRGSAIRRNISLDAAFEEQDIMKDSESVEELVLAERVPGDSDEGESKYIGEEKVVVEEQRSVSELKEIFAADKRDRQYERQPSVGSVTEEPVRPVSMIESRTTTTTTTVDERPKSTVVERVVELTEAEPLTLEEIRQKFSASQPETITTVTKVTKKTSGIPTKISDESSRKSEEVIAKTVVETKSIKKEVEVTPKGETKVSGIPVVSTKTTVISPKEAEVVSKTVSEVTVTTKSGIPVTTKTVKTVTESSSGKTVVEEEAVKIAADQRRDSELFQGVSEELGRLETTFKVVPVEDGILSPKVSKTPPPSPAEFNRDQTATSGQSAWTTGAPPSTEPKTSSQDWSVKDQTKDIATDSVAIAGIISPKIARPSDDLPLPSAPTRPDISNTPRDRLRHLHDLIYVDMSRGSREHSVSGEEERSEENSKTLDESVDRRASPVGLKPWTDEYEQEDLDSQDLETNYEGLSQKMAEYFERNEAASSPRSGDFDLSSYFPEMKEDVEPGVFFPGVRQVEDDDYVEISPQSFYENAGELETSFDFENLDVVERCEVPLQDFTLQQQNILIGLPAAPPSLHRSEAVEDLNLLGSLTTLTNINVSEEVESKLSPGLFSHNDGLYEEFESPMISRKKMDLKNEAQLTVDNQSLEKPRAKPEIPPKPTLIKPRVVKVSETKSENVENEEIPARGFFVSLLSEKPSANDGGAESMSQGVAELQQLEATVERILSEVALQENLLLKPEHSFHETSGLAPKDAIHGPRLEELGGEVTHVNTWEVRPDETTVIELLPRRKGKTSGSGGESSFKCEQVVMLPEENIKDLGVVDSNLIERNVIVEKAVSDIHKPVTSELDTKVVEISDLDKRWSMERRTLEQKTDNIEEINTVIDLHKPLSSVYDINDKESNEIDGRKVRLSFEESWMDASKKGQFIIETRVSPKPSLEEKDDGHNNVVSTGKVQVSSMEGRASQKIHSLSENANSLPESSKPFPAGSKDDISTDWVQVRMNDSSVSDTGSLSVKFGGQDKPVADAEIADSLVARLDRRKQLKKALSDESNRNSFEMPSKEEDNHDSIHEEDIIEKIETSVDKLLTDIKDDELSLELFETGSSQSRESSSMTDRVRLSSEESDDLWWGRDRSMPLALSQAEYWESVRLDNLDHSSPKLRDKHVAARESMTTLPRRLPVEVGVLREEMTATTTPRKVGFGGKLESDNATSLVNEPRRVSACESTGCIEDVRNDPMFSNIFAKEDDTFWTKKPGSSTSKISEVADPWTRSSPVKYREKVYDDGNISRILANFPSSSPSPVPSTSARGNDELLMWASLPTSRQKDPSDDGNIKRILARPRSYQEGIKDRTGSLPSNNIPPPKKKEKFDDGNIAKILAKYPGSSSSSSSSSTLSKQLNRASEAPARHFNTLPRMTHEPISRLYVRSPGIEPALKSYSRTPPLNTTLPVLQHLKSRQEDTPSPDFDTTSPSSSSSSTCSSPDYFASPPLRFPSLQLSSPAIPLTGPPITTSPITRSYITPPPSLPATPILPRRIDSSGSHSPSPGYNIASSNLQRIPPIESLESLMKSSTSAASFFSSHPYHSLMTTSERPSSSQDDYAWYNQLQFRPSPVVPSAGYCNWSSQSDSRESTPRGGDTGSEWGPQEMRTTTTTTTTTTIRGGDGASEGASGGVTVTQTETSVVEGSEEMQELLEKLAAEARK